MARINLFYLIKMLNCFYAYYLDYAKKEYNNAILVIQVVMLRQSN